MLGYRNNDNFQINNHILLGYGNNHNLDDDLFLMGRHLTINFNYYNINFNILLKQLQFCIYFCRNHCQFIDIKLISIFYSYFC